jgi:hypothetical protein
MVVLFFRSLVACSAVELLSEQIDLLQFLGLLFCSSSSFFLLARFQGITFQNEQFETLQIFDDMSCCFDEEFSFHL